MTYDETKKSKWRLFYKVTACTLQNCPCYERQEKTDKTEEIRAK